ncbi:hypothetical protein DRN74_06855 [Candidatus Micrarchaeota archaeon]|nr:MAG: hypothetical protein DRN74_06855 [Candidatus Micrarchaeota archaeon]
MVPAWLSLLASAIGGGLASGVGAILLDHLWLEPRRRAQEIREKKITDLHSYLDEFAILYALYALRLRGKAEIIRNQDGSFVKDASGKPVYKETLLPPDPSVDQAMMELEGVDLSTAITIQHIIIRKTAARTLHSADDLDSTGGLHRAFQELYAKMREIDLTLKMGGVLAATKLLTEFYELQKELRHKLNRFISPT